MNWTEQALDVAAALAVGLLIGIERGWRQRSSREGTRVAGVRTFTLMGILAGLAGLIGRSGQALAAAAMIAAAAAVIATGYALRSNEDRKSDATTAIAGLVTLALGFVAG